MVQKQIIDDLIVRKSFSYLNKCQIEIKGVSLTLRMLFNSRAAALQDLYIKVINATQSSILRAVNERIYYIYCIQFIYAMQFKAFFELVYHSYIITYCNWVFSKHFMNKFIATRIWGGYCNTWLDVILMDMRCQYMKSWALTLLCDLLDSDVSEDPSHGWWNCSQRSCTHSHYLDIRSQQIFAW